MVNVLNVEVRDVNTDLFKGKTRVNPSKAEEAIATPEFPLR